MRRSGRVFGLIWPPVLFGAVFLLLWELAVKVFDFQPYFLPAPSAIWDAFTTNTALIWEATKVSGLNAFIAENANTLPVEFKLTGIKPTRWTPEALAMRTPTFGDAGSELQLARLVAQLPPREQRGKRKAPDRQCPWKRPHKEQHRQHGCGIAHRDRLSHQGGLGPGNGERGRPPGGTGENDRYQQDARQIFHRCGRGHGCVGTRTY